MAPAEGSFVLSFCRRIMLRQVPSEVKHLPKIAVLTSSNIHYAIAAIGGVLPAGTIEGARSAFGHVERLGMAVRAKKLMKLRAPR